MFFLLNFVGVCHVFIVRLVCLWLLILLLLAFGRVCFMFILLCGVLVSLVVLKRFLYMTRKYSGEFAHKNYASLFCEVFDSDGSFCALFHYRVYCGKPMLTIDNVSLSAGLLKYEVMNFLSKAAVSCNYPNPAQMTVELTDLPLF